MSDLLRNRGLEEGVRIGRREGNEEEDEAVKVDIEEEKEVRLRLNLKVAVGGAIVVTLFLSYKQDKKSFFCFLPPE